MGGILRYGFAWNSETFKWQNKFALLLFNRIMHN